jgi:hypothetical protein
MNSDQDPACAGGCPIRTSLDHSLLAAPQGLSQRATSFIASWRQGIHQMPFSRSLPSPPAPVGRTPPGTDRQTPRTAPTRAAAQGNPKRPSPRPNTARRPHHAPRPRGPAACTRAHAHSHTVSFDAPGTPRPGPVPRSRGRTVGQTKTRPGTPEAPQPRFTTQKTTTHARHARTPDTHARQTRTRDPAAPVRPDPLAPAPLGAGANSSTPPQRHRRSQERRCLETTGLEPATPCLQSRRSPS